MRVIACEYNSNGNPIKVICEDNCEYYNFFRVVRCRDCVNCWFDEHCENGVCDVNPSQRRVVYPDDFCSYAERRKVTDEADMLLEDFGEEPLVWNNSEAEIQERNDWHRYKNIVESQPTVDAMLVKRGRWVRSSPFIDTFECSECGYDVLDEELRTPYCPWCGTKMNDE